jgi:hypothetical protein
MNDRLLFLSTSMHFAVEGEQQQDRQDAQFSFLMVVPAMERRALHRISIEMHFLCSLYGRIVLTKSSLWIGEYSGFQAVLQESFQIDNERATKRRGDAKTRRMTAGDNLTECCS